MKKKTTTTYDNIYKIAAGMEDDYATGYLLGYPYFKKAYKMISTDANVKAIQPFNFTGNLETAGNTKVFFIFEKVKETISDFSQRTLRGVY